MKKVFLWMFLLPVIQFLQAQEKNVLMLTDFKIELNGETVEQSQEFSEPMPEDVTQNLIVFENDEIKYGVEFTYKHRGSRAILVRRTFVLLPDGSQKYSKQKKDMQELKVSIPGSFKGKSIESILYNKEKMQTIWVSFQYEYHYK